MRVPNNRCVGLTIALSLCIMQAAVFGQAVVEAPASEDQEQRLRESAAHYQSAFKLEQAAEFEKAIAEYNKASAIFPKSPAVHYRLALCWKAKGDREKMLQALRLTLKFNDGELKQLPPQDAERARS